MLDEVITWIFLIAFLATATGFACFCVWGFRKWIGDPTAWEEAKRLYPVPEGVTASFWGWQKAFVRYGPNGTLCYLRIQVTEEGLLMCNEPMILFGKRKDYMIHLKWDRLVYPYEVPYPWSTRFLRSHIEFQVYGTAISIIASRRFWEPLFPEGFLDEALEEASETESPVG